MASNINYQDINEAYPVAGVDNDSQGFRDNFGTIKNSLSAAKTEIDVLQNTTVKNNADNLMNFNKIQQVELVQSQLGFNAIGSIQTNTTIEYNRGHYQAFTVAYDINTFSNVVLQFINWPTDGLAKLEIQVTSNESKTRKIIWDTEDSGAFKYSQSYRDFLTAYLVVTDDLTNVLNQPGVGTVIRGASSGATATVVAIDTANGNNRLVLNKVKGNFAAGGEAILARVDELSLTNLSLTTPISDSWTAPAFVVDSSLVETNLDVWTYDGGRNVYIDYKGQFSI
jgi:hypothetical protein